MLKNPFAVLSSLVIGAVVVILAMFMFIGPLFERNKSDSATCVHTNELHIATIENGKITPEHTYAKKCDTLTITNKDHVMRLIAFGQHEDHVPYNGISEQGLSNGQSFTVTLDQAGSYIFHDHYHESVSAEFTVTD